MDSETLMHIENLLSAAAHMLAEALPPDDFEGADLYELWTMFNHLPIVCELYELLSSPYHNYLLHHYGEDVEGIAAASQLFT